MPLSAVSVAAAPYCPSTHTSPNGFNHEPGGPLDTITMSPIDLDAYLSPDRTPLLAWCRNAKDDQFTRHLVFGSTALFGAGGDTDVMFLLDEVPEELRHLVPPPVCASEYDECFHRMQDTATGHDFFFVHRDRFAEFEVAMAGFRFILEEASKEVWTLLETNKPLRVAVFRGLRSTAPNSELSPGSATSL